uniref:Uncharacterized protein n=1 Tax=Plectus sambesii TaxID=2011161 RepID=A0A914VGJ5_9BILA
MNGSNRKSGKFERVRSASEELPTPPGSAASVRRKQFAQKKATTAEGVRALLIRRLSSLHQQSVDISSSISALRKFHWMMSTNGAGSSQTAYSASFFDAYNWV